MPWSDLVREMGDALEQEVDSFVSIARRTAAFRASREHDVIRLTLEVSIGGHGLPDAGQTVDGAIAELEAARDEALRYLDAANDDKAELAHRALDADRERIAAERDLKRLKSRLKQLEKQLRQAAKAVPAEDSAAASATTDLELIRERASRAVAEASFATLERVHEQALFDLIAERERRTASEDDLAAIQHLNSDLQAEIGALWRLLRDTRPGDTLAITLTVPVDEDARREGIERVQAKIIDARERFKRRNHRWPIAI